MTWIEKIAVGRITNRPVNVFARAIHALERLFVQQAHQTMFLAVLRKTVINNC